MLVIKVSRRTQRFDVAYLNILILLTYFIDNKRQLLGPQLTCRQKVIASQITGLRRRKKNVSRNLSRAVEIQAGNIKLTYIN